jgi:hypothetical protein
MAATARRFARVSTLEATMRRKLILIPAVVGALLLAACGSVKIGRINADPTRYQNKTVRVTGTVTQSMGVLGTGGYQVQDDSGKIYVISSTGVPSKGSRVTVKGRVQSGVNILGRSFGTAIREQSHDVK